MSKKEILYKSLLLIPSFAVIFFIIYALNVRFHSSGANLSNFVHGILSKQILSGFIKTLLFSFSALLITCIIGMLFSFAKHFSVSDMWLSVLNYVVVSIPLSAFFFGLVYIFSKVFKLLPLKGYFSLISYVLPIALNVIFFSLYLSFKARFEKYSENIALNDNARKAGGMFLKQFSEEMWLFIFMVVFTETLFALGGAGAAFINNLSRGLSLYSALYLCAIFIFFRYILSLLSFAFYRARD